MNLFDTHCHLADERFSKDLDDVITRMRDAGVGLCVVVGDASDADETQSVLRLCEQNDGMYAAFGVHPHNASAWNEDSARRLERALAHPKAVALGEIGLDYHYDFSPRPVQIEVFEAQLDAALRLGKPVALHVREAHGKTTEILRARYRAGRLPTALLHCYSGSWESAKTYLSMGLYVSLSGSATFKNASKLRDVAQNMPLDRLLIETDCPYLAPEPVRGRRNEPAYVAHTCARIAQLRGVSPEELADATTRNGRRFFALD
jgi:TatD DNase family protein